MKAVWNWIKDNKVFFIGLVGALAVALQQFVGVTTVDWLAVGYAAGIAVLSYIANQWRGQGMTITGIIGTLAWAFAQAWTGGHVDWNQLIIMSFIALGSAVSPPPKGQHYEESNVIKSANEKP